MTNGKGSTPRRVNRKRYAENWDQVFGKKAETKEAHSPLSTDPFWESVQEASDQIAARPQWEKGGAKRGSDKKT